MRAEIVELSKSEILDGFDTGVRRTRGNRLSGAPSRRYSRGETDEEIDIRGVLGEIGVAKFYGGTWDRTIHPGHDNYDVLLPCCGGEHRIGVRAANGDGKSIRYLILSNSGDVESLPSLPTAATILKVLTVKVYGWWQPGDPVMTDDLGYGKRLVVPLEDLRSQDELLDHIRSH